MTDPFSLIVADTIREREVLFSDYVGGDGLIDMEAWAAAVAALDEWREEAA